MVNRRDKLIVFDLDGVLVDACDWHKQALNKALEECQFSPISEEDHRTKYNGLPTRVKLTKLDIPREFHDKISDLKQKYTKQLIHKNTVVSLEKIQLVADLKTLGFYVACYTNSITETAELMLSKLGILDLLDFVLTNEMVNNPKPSPEGYIKVMKNFKVRPERTIIIEDSEKGKRAGIDSGALVFLVENATEVTRERIIKICEQM